MKNKPVNAIIHVRGAEITLLQREDGDYISLTDIAKSRNPEHPDDLIRNWLRNRNTLELIGIWEQIHNDDFNPVEFDGIKKQAGLNSFTLTPKQWIDRTAAIGIVSKAGRYGGTYAHTDLAFEFASWVSVEFKLYLIKEFQRLKADENRRLSLGWNLSRTLAKINYRLHTHAIQSHLIPAEVTPKQASFTYANEADILNVALFGKTAREWREDNPGKDGNMRDHASLEQLLVLANLESMNAEFIHMALPQSDRLKRLNAIAIRQMQTLAARTARQLEE
jgi:hypothetical protein